ncbi:kinesin-like protein KIN-7N isoform X2 [Carica papaya]|uniref:kinesin-like protein KIN-7N isoform X2 n=1 Tax=Carica papaya TaxID=3649 RepID=UPI000B8CE833|nr:kinesin-like protein KIN-7N isoform X2 [Carica papaya]
MEKICVAVRVRPAVTEEASGNRTHWKVEDNRISLHRLHGTPISGVSYAFDHIFDETCTNSRVYDLLTKEIIHSALEGFNGTAFAYGQTSSGKTFTMNGSATDPGIIHQAVKDIFDRIQMISDREFLIRVSYMEIYNEEINDLLTLENQKLQIHESLERGIFVAGLREEIVNSAEQVLKLIESGEVNRHFGETNMNVRSSRSHTIFRMVIESKGKETSSSNDFSSTDVIRVSVLNLVDLAGSERIAKTGAGGVRLKEGKYINKSLMILGNVINKLSDGAKNRGHIPYRDSKLTRILQPALGGNAKTSIICTIAPEEVHIEETKGTLQFASRAKRITNCAQVNEILSDGALLKRQKLEIEELRRKLQGSRAEVLEQEILKLRNDMLKYELEHEKLEMQLEEERRSQREREQCIREQQMKIDNLSSLVTNSDCDRNSSEEKDSVRQRFKEECHDSNSICQRDVFTTPCFKAAPNAFVVKRSNNSRLSDYSPLLDSFSYVADEDTWMKLNKGHVTDLDLLLMTPARKELLPSNDVCSHENNEEVENLKRQLAIITEEKNDLERKHSEQALLNDQLTGEISVLKQEALLVQEIPRRFCESVASCKDIYEDILSMTQTFNSEGEFSIAKLLSGTCEIGMNILSTLETHFTMGVDVQKSFPLNKSLIQEQLEVLRGQLKNITDSFLSETICTESEQVKNPTYSCNNKEKLSDELETIKEKYHELEKNLVLKSQLLEVSEERFESLVKEFQVLKQERDSLLEKVAVSSQKLAEVTHRKENVLKDLNTEVQGRKDLEDEIKKFSVAFASRQQSLVSFCNEFKSNIEKLRAQNPVLVSKSFRY